MANPFATSMEAPSTTKKRYLFIDLYRSAVIFFMLEGHLLRELLEPHLQRTTAFQFHELFHGLSAPAFLFGAGLTFVISTRTRWEDYHHWGPPLARRVRRICFLLLLGLWLHLPYFSFRKIVMEGTTDDYLQLFQSDVLACIGLGLLALHGLIFFFKKESRFYSLVLITILTVCFLTPLVWDIDFLHSLPISIAQLMNSTHGSVFPIFPFVGFLFMGVIISWEFSVFAEQQREKLFIKRMMVLGAILMVAGLVFDVLPFQIYPTYNFWYTSPSYFIIRAGALMLFTGACWYLANVITARNDLLTILGKESLFVYVLHLVVLYGSVVNPKMNIRSLVGASVGFLPSSGIIILFTLSMVITAVLWNYLKEKHFTYYRLIQIIGSGIFLYYFLTREY